MFFKRHRFHFLVSPFLGLSLSFSSLTVFSDFSLCSSLLTSLSSHTHASLKICICVRVSLSLVFLSSSSVFSSATLFNSSLYLWFCRVSLFLHALCLSHSRPVCLFITTHVMRDEQTHGSRRKDIPMSLLLFSLFCCSSAPQSFHPCTHVDVYESNFKNIEMKHVVF